MKTVLGEETESIRSKIHSRSLFMLYCIAYFGGRFIAPIVVLCALRICLEVIGFLYIDRIIAIVLFFFSARRVYMQYKQEVICIDNLVVCSGYAFSCFILFFIRYGILLSCLKP